MDPSLFTDDWKEFLALLHSNRVKYLLIGGIACNLHGHERSTKDLDVWVENSAANVARLKRALVGFGFKEMADAIGPRMDEREALFIGKKPYRIDLLSGVSGIKFAPTYRRRIYKKHDGLRLPLADLDDLLANKLASGRYQDLADAQALRRLIELRKQANGS